MLKRLALMLVLVAGLLASQRAGAQFVDVCTGQSTSTPPSYVDYSVAVGVVCVDPTPWTVRTNTVGALVWRYCRVSSGWATQRGAVTWQYLAEHAGLAQALAGLSKTATNSQINDIAKTYIDTPLADPKLTPIWCPFRQEMRDGKPATTTGNWYAQGTRIWMTAGGLLSAPVSPPRSAVLNAPCDCVRLRITTGTANYCTLAGGPATEVTACKLGP